MLDSYFDYYGYPLYVFSLEWCVTFFSFTNEMEDQEYLSVCIYPVRQDNCFIHDELTIFPDVYVDGFVFSNLMKSTYSETYVGFNENYIIKIEQKKCINKLNDLKKCIEIVRYLNARGCVSCPQLLLDGQLDSGQPYCIQERIKPAYDFCYADMIFAIIEQKCLGVCQGDFKRENLIFAANGICFIVDYDQAIIDNCFIEMSNFAYLDWFESYFKSRWHFDASYYELFQYERFEINCLFRNGSFNLATTTIMKKQVTTDTDSGIYHNFSTTDIFISGARSFRSRLQILNSMKFKKLEAVLDIGCNLGLLGHYLKDRGCVVTGVDMDPLIVKAAKMVANIVRKDIRFYHHDLDVDPITEFYDTICLFSVLHHARDCSKVAYTVAQNCNRVIIESKLHEVGSKFVNGKWVASGG